MTESRKDVPQRGTSDQLPNGSGLVRTTLPAGAVSDDSPVSHVAEVVMANTAKHNSFSAAMCQEFVAALRHCVDSGARAIIVRAESGVKVWSAGHDISELPTGEQDPLAWDNTLAAMMDDVAAIPVPLIAAVEGGVWGGGCELAVACDLIVAMRSSTFAITPAKLGVAYRTSGVAHFLAALPVHIVNEMFFTAEPITCERAYQLGMVNRVVDSEPELTRVSRELAATISSRAPLTVRSTKAEIRAVAGVQASTPQAEHRAQLFDAAWTSADYQEGVQAFKERRTPEFKGK